MVDYWQESFEGCLAESHSQVRTRIDAFLARKNWLCVQNRFFGSEKNNNYYNINNNNHDNRNNNNNRNKIIVIKIKITIIKIINNKNNKNSNNHKS